MFMGWSLPKAIRRVQYRQAEMTSGSERRTTTNAAWKGRTPMQLPDEAISYDYHGLLIPAVADWTPAAELREQHFLDPARLRDLNPRLMQVRSQIAAERELRNPPPEMKPLDAGFIDLPQKLLDDHRRHTETSTLGRVLRIAE